MKNYKITQTETHFAQAENEDTLRDLWKQGAIDGSGILEIEIEEMPSNQLKRYTILSGTIYEIEANSKDEAMAKLDNLDELDEGEALSDFYGSQPCDKCETDFGWHEDDYAGITFGGLKQAQNEAILRGIQYAMDYLEDINYHDGANVLNEYWAFMSDPESVKMPDWQSVFHAGHSLYSTKCEGSN